MIKVGIAGGIGSGKSVVCKIFASLGVSVFDADTAAKEAMVNNSNIRTALVKHFGAEVYNTDGQLNRPYLAGLVFNNADKLKLLNSIVHPETFAEYERWNTLHKREPYVVKEAALMYESGADKLNDVNILVKAPLELRIQRAMQRDGSTKEQVLARIAKQWTDEQKEALADVVIINDEQTPLLPQVLALHKRFTGE